MKNSELIGVLASIDQVFDSGPDRRCVVGTIRLANRECATVKGYAREDEMERGVTYRFYGHNKTHPRYGPQFNFNSFVEESPVDEDSVLAYLETCRHPDRGSVTHRVAVLLFERFGLKAIDKLIDDPVAAADGIKQWGPEKASIAASHLKSSRGTQRCKLDLIMLLNGRGFPKKTIDRCIKLWGASAANVVRENPFELVHLPGIGFRGADKMYCDLARQSSATDQEYQVKLGAINRQGLCLTYAVQCESRSSGSTWIPTPFALSRVTQQIGGTMADPQGALQWAMLEGTLVEYRGHVAISRMATHELDIAAAVTAADDNHDWPSIDEIAAMVPDGKPLSDHQLDAIRLATSQRIGALQGSPGVGKTFAVACVVKALIGLYGKDCIAVAAPTGKAGVRVAQSMAANGVDLPASTIHRLLVVETEGRDGWSFHYHEQNPLPNRFIIADECFVAGTMIDIDFDQMPIESIKPGQAIRNAIGFDYVLATSRKVATHVTKINVGKTEIVCSPSHRLLTNRGFIFASEVKSGDTIIRTSEAVRLLWNRDKAEAQESCLSSFLQHTLLNEMVDAVSGIQKQSIYARACEEIGSRTHEIPELREPGSCRTNRKNSQLEPNEEPMLTRCVLSETQADKAQASSSRREWQGPYKATGGTHESDRQWMGYRVRGERLGQDSGLPHLLQTRSGEPKENDCDRNRRTVSMLNEAERKGQEKGFVSLGERVDCVETYESSSPELDQFRNADGIIYLYDLQAARHKSYSVEGFLVHNCSMIDTDLLASLLRACTPSTHILFVGDSNQLAPVGHGRPFFDLQSCIPTGHLTEIRRNSGRIVQSCAEIRDRNSITFSPKLDLPQENLPLIEVETSQAPDVCENLIARYRASGLDVIEHMQFLTAKNDNSPVARKPLNKLLQQVLNQNGEQVHGNPFRLGDKIVCLKNASYPDPEEQHEQHFIANGELGRVTSLKPGRMIIKLSDPPRSILVTHAPVQDSERDVADSEDAQRGAVGDWDLGYALSVHRSQGSQWQYVVVLADPSGGMVQTREWLYTGISRAETATFVIGNRQVVNQMLRRNGIKTRKTFLVERVAELRPFVLCLETLWEGV